MKRTLVILAAFLVAATGWIVVAQDYDLREERVEIGDLRGVLAKPPGDGPFGLVVFVHGDGPIDATHDGHYRPLWEEFGRAGYASLSWDKPGVADAPGNWLHQSMRDRADETAGAITWARGRPDVDPRRIGLWGASQAGWVLPRLAATNTDVRFVIAVSPAVNWLRQGEYDLVTSLRGRPEAEVRAALDRRGRRLALLARDASYAEYREVDPDMTEDRWRFVTLNHRSDASADLAASRVPVFLALGDHDVHVDADETARVYADLVPDLEVHRYRDATHGLAEPAVEDSAVWGTLVALFAPRSVYADGVLDDQRRFLERR
ncbi:CocE/NonD family hydrolase [Saccharothrix violaceirubra]|uniref:Serine aminopeptidase S33 domain-containing protein n=1 Tax=Saccharothrix violaceirubra TaxID=413306 RepID=A0A7W7T1M0_9PSEU|nr:alpha/beta hydrolase [Saccharothrix violaceirubra]MBB4964888.1 hypothetical protein [Saccharothrix violaceirubra]